MNAMVSEREGSKVTFRYNFVEGDLQESCNAWMETEGGISVEGGLRLSCVSGPKEEDRADGCYSMSGFHIYAVLSRVLY
jgi:hypothetical protein